MKIESEWFETIKALPRPLLVAVCGFKGSGKSSLARALGESLGAPVVDLESFQKPGYLDGNYTCWETFDFARLEKELLIPFQNQSKTIRYGEYDPKEKGIGMTWETKNKGQLVVEGPGLFRAELLKYFSYKIWVDCPPEVGIARGKKRDEERQLPGIRPWEILWKKNDAEYFDKFKPREAAQMIIDNSNQY